MDPTPSTRSDPSTPSSATAPQPSTAWPPEQVVIQQPGGLGLGQVPEPLPTFDFSDGASNGPGLRARGEAPGEPSVTVELRPQAVGGATPPVAGQDVRHEPSADGRSVQQTVLLHERPGTNVLDYALDLRGLEVSPEAEGSLSLRDHAGRALFTLPAPGFMDAQGEAGSASYRLGPANRLEIVLDPALVGSGPLPLEVETSIIAAPGLWEQAPAPWQRQAVVAKDGTQFFAFFDPTSGASGIKFVTSSTDWASGSSPTTIVPDLGGEGFSVEIDHTTDTIFLALTGLSGGNNVLQLYPLAYDGQTRTWTVGSPITLQSDPVTSWSGATVIIERGSQDFLWVAADEGNADDQYTMRAWFTTLTDGALGSTWTSAYPPFPTLTKDPHYSALVAVTDGVVAVGREDTSQRSSSYRRGSGWDALKTIDTAAWDGTTSGKEYSLLAAADPRSDGSSVFVPLVALRPTAPNGTGGHWNIYALRDGADSWSNTGAGADVEALKGQLTWDGTTFHFFYLKRTARDEYQVNGRRGRLTSGVIVVEEERAWLVEPQPEDRNLKWLGLPRLLTGYVVPLFYIRDYPDPTPDQLRVYAERLALLGQRNAWEYQEIKLPGAGVLRVNLANGNVHYEVEDANFASRRWNDQLKRAYNAQASDPDTGFSSIWSPGWTGLATPTLQFFDGDNRVVYWAGDGGQFTYLKKNATVWNPELGLHMTLEKSGSGDRTWKLTDPSASSGQVCTARRSSSIQMAG